jgi:hypothetical protein
VRVTIVKIVAQSGLIPGRLLGTSAKRRERLPPRPITNECVRGALSWGNVMVEDFSRGAAAPVSAILGLSADSLIVIDRQLGDVVFAAPTHAIIGWHQQALGWVELNQSPQLTMFVLQHENLLRPRRGVDVTFARSINVG